jgi:hypothetical protein
LGIRLSFVKTSEFEFRGEGEFETPLGTSMVLSLTEGHKLKTGEIILKNRSSFLGELRNAGRHTITIN